MGFNSSIFLCLCLLIQSSAGYWNSAYKKGTGCGGTLTDPSGIISSPGFPLPYSNNVDCTWLIQAPPGSTIEIEFMSFDIEKSGTSGVHTSSAGSLKGALKPFLTLLCKWLGPIPGMLTSNSGKDSNDCWYDSLMIHDGSSHDDPLLGLYCGNSKPSIISSTSNQMSIMFKSDESETNDNRRIKNNVDRKMDRNFDRKIDRNFDRKVDR